VVFALAASSIACLLFDFYGIASMRSCAAFVFGPSVVALAALGLFDRARGDGQLCRVLWMGMAAGLLAAVGYDLFRLPFVFAQQWRLDSVIAPMNLFKVFPQFGAMLLGEPLGQERYRLPAHLLGWAYHFSNGASFGVMYLALVGNPAAARWLSAVLFALGLELGMLLTPYPARFAIPLTTRFVVVTLAAHSIFGLMLRWSIGRFRRLQ
jgi:hypothetical protein